MHSASSNYQLYIVVQELDDDSFPPQCGILIDLVEREWPADFEIDRAPVPVLLDHASDVLLRFCLRLNSLHYTLRVVQPPAPHPLEPETLITADEVNACIAQLGSRAHDESLYRTEIWCIADGPSKVQALEAIRGFETLDKDIGMFDQAVGLGAMRLTLEMSSLTLTLACSDLAEATDWVKYALETAAVPVRWSL
jgi:hypothetical protein